MAEQLEMDVELEYVDDDEAQNIDVDMDDPVEEPFTYDERSLNLVEEFEAHEDGKKALAEIFDFVSRSFDDAWDSTAEYRERVAKDWKLFAGDLPAKNFPFDNCANGNIPIMAENTMRIHARLFSEIFGDWTSVIGAVPVSQEDEGVAQAISKHDNWQLREEIIDFPRQMDRALMLFIVNGDVAVHSYYDEQRRTNRHEVLTPDEFVTPYSMVSTMPDYSDLPYYCKVLHHHRHELQGMREKWSNVDRVLERKNPQWDDDPDGEMRGAIGETQGEAVPDSTDYQAPYKLVQFEGYCACLPEQRNDRFIQCIFDPSTRNILSLRIHETVHWKDKAEQRRKQAELDTYHDAKAQVEELRAKQARDRADAIGRAIDENADAGEQAVLMQDLDGSGPIPEPPRPDWVEEDEVPRDVPASPREPIRMFAHGVNIEPILGGLGLGYGRIQSDFTRAANTMLNQWIDAATLGNAPPVYSTVDLPKDQEYTPGKVLKVDGFTEKLADSFFPLPVGNANPQLLEGVGQMYNYAQSSAQAPDVLSGAEGKSGETFRGISSRIEQATKQLSTMGRKFAYTVLRQVVVNNAKLNAIFLDDVQMRAILNPLTNQYENLQIRRDMYERDYRVELRADLRFTSETQKQQEAMELVTLPQAVPQLQMNAAFVYDALVDFFNSKNRPDLIPSLGAKPAPPPEFGAPPPMPGGPPGPPGPPGAPPGMPPGGGGPTQ